MKYFMTHGVKYEIIPISNEDMTEIIAAEKSEHRVIAFPVYYSPDGRLYPLPHPCLKIESDEK